MLRLAELTAIALLSSYFGVRLIRYFTERHGILDVPNERSSHSVSVPRGGGLAIVAITIAGVWVYSRFEPDIPPGSLLIYTVCALLIAGVSWLDDIRSQPSWLRLSIHSVAALGAIYAFGSLPFVGKWYVSGFQFGWLGFVITFLWIVGLTNAYNFMDGIDGIAGAQAIVVALTVAVVGFVSQQPTVTAFGVLLASTSLGFLFHNWHPARIFMGDVGSAFLGYTFAVIPLISYSHFNQRGGGVGAVAAAMLSLWPFVFDTLFTFLRRLRLGENIFGAHRSHLYQRLVIAGYSHSSVSLLYGGLAAIGAVLGLSWMLRVHNYPIVFVLLPLLWVGVWSFVIQEERKYARSLSAGRAARIDEISTESN